MIKGQFYKKTDKHSSLLRQRKKYDSMGTRRQPRQPRSKRVSPQRVELATADDRCTPVVKVLK